MIWYILIPDVIVLYLPVIFFQDLFFKYPLNSFLHATAESFIRFLVYRSLAGSSTCPSPLAPISSDLFSASDEMHNMFFGPSSEDSKSSTFCCYEQQQRLIAVTVWATNLVVWMGIAYSWFVHHILLVWLIGQSHLLESCTCVAGWFTVECYSILSC